MERANFLFEILYYSSTVKTSKNVSKKGCFKKILRWKHKFFDGMKEQHQVFYVKIFFKLIF